MIKHTPVTPPELTLINTTATITVAFCIHRNNPTHEQFISFFLNLGKTRALSCRVIRVYPTSADAVIEAIERTPLTLIVCLDNQLAPAVLQAKNKLLISAPLIFVDIEQPKNAAHLPPSCVTISTPTALFTERFCSILTCMPNIKKVGILYDRNDAILANFLTPLTEWLAAHSFQPNAVARKPNISSSDILFIRSLDLLILLCRSTPSDYLERLVVVCKKQNTILYATHHAGFFAGAPFAFVPPVASMAKEAVNILIRYLNTNSIGSPVQVDCQLLVNNHEVRNNAALAGQINTFLDLSQSIKIATPTTAEKISAYLRLEQAPLE